ncbi:competence/damage-inducible protein A [Pelagibacteraceae bacterium]|nr:competence/damage-inducible protein A [Pelagibacteraceae bacterium]
MKKSIKKINAAIVIIGNEILSGRTQDINLIVLSKWLNELGVKIEEVRIVPDDETAIVHTVNFLRVRFKYIFTTGGIGPTHDDITSKSIAKAFNLKYGKHKEAYKLLENYYGAKNFNTGRKKMAMMPIKSSLILNPSSGAPGFIVDNVYCLPGVPSILKSMLGGLKNKIIGGKKIYSETISIKTVESEIASSLEKVQKKYNNTEIGSYPFFKQGKIGVSIVIRSPEKKIIIKCLNEIKKFIRKKKIRIIIRN